MIQYILLIGVLLILLYLYSSQENFYMVQDAEFRGMNILGMGTEDESIPVSSILECRRLCEESKKCVGISYFKPNGACYLYSSGGVIPNDQGFMAGFKDY